ncbi:MAG: hypothetical protein ABEJ83_02800 [Candidatus Nanohaloarchaea archaeon]
MIIASLVLIASYSFNSFIRSSPENTVKNFYDQALENSPEVFNKAFRTNTSPRYVSKQLYLYNSFLETRSAVRGAKFSSIEVFVMPEIGQLRILNYRENKTVFNVTINSNYRKIELKALQTEKLSFTPGTVDIKIFSRHRINKTFQASNPRLLTYKHVSDEDESWKKAVLH